MKKTYFFGIKVISYSVNIPLQAGNWVFLLIAKLLKPPSPLIAINPPVIPPYLPPYYPPYHYYAGVIAYPPTLSPNLNYQSILKGILSKFTHTHFKR